MIEWVITIFSIGLLYVASYIGSIKK